MNANDLSTIKRLVTYFKSDDSLLLRNKGEQQKSVVTFRQCANEVGLSHEQIFDIAEVAARMKFGQHICHQLIYSLIPRENLPEEVALMIISKICADLQSLKIKQLLIRWLILVFDLIPSKVRLHCLYGIIFRYIESDALCPAVCHLLFLLTRKKDVTNYRIAKLLDLQRRLGTQPHLCGLLSIYRMYHPSLITISGGYSSFFKKLDKKWEASMVRVQQRFGLHFLDEGLDPRTAPRLNEKQKKNASLIKQPNINAVHDYTESQQPFSNLLSHKLQVHEIKSFRNLLDNFSQLQLTSQAYTLLHSTTLRHIIAISSDRTIAVRLSFWLHHWLNQELVSTCGETNRGTELIKVVVEFSGLIQECLPVCESFLFRYLYTWNGDDYRSSILNLTTKLRILPFQDLHTFVLMPLRKLYTFSSYVYFKIANAPELEYLDTYFSAFSCTVSLFHLKCSILSTLSDLLSNYLTIESRKQEMLKELGTVSDADMTRFSVYPQKLEEVNVDHTVVQLVGFVNSMFVESVRTVKNNLLLLHYMLQFHLQVSCIYSRHGKVLVLLPPVQLVHEALFSFSAPSIAILCRTLLNHRKTLAALVALGKLTSSMEDVVSKLNQYLIDVFDTLWRRRAFPPFCSDGSVLYRNIGVDQIRSIVEGTEIADPHRMFALDRHPALTINVKNYLQLLGRFGRNCDEGEFVFEESFVEYLESRGLNDVTDFIKQLRSPS